MHEFEQNIVDEIQLQVADSEGMVDVEKNKAIEEQETILYAEVASRLKQHEANGQESRKPSL